jgi:hypothetical protein
MEEWSCGVVADVAAFIGLTFKSSDDANAEALPTRRIHNALEYE